MDIHQIAKIFTEFGLPVAISGLLGALVKALFDALQRRSKESLLDWLAQPSATEPFKGDDRALRALHELQQSLVFERAFGLKAESRMRNELLSFAESQHESLRFRDVLDINRIVSRLSFPQLGGPKQIKYFKALSRFSKLTSYLGIAVGGIVLYGYVNFIVDSGLKELRSNAGGLVFGALMWLGGLYNFKIARRFEIAADFLRWHSEKRSESAD
jgi:hypothetical protein